MNRLTQSRRTCTHLLLRGVEDVCSSPPVRAPKSQIAVEQPLTGDTEAHQKKIPHTQRQRRNPNKMA